jgi:hypothetical protein
LRSSNASARGIGGQALGCDDFKNIFLASQIRLGT